MSNINKFINILVISISSFTYLEVQGQGWTLLDGTSKVNQLPKHVLKGTPSDSNFWGSRSNHYAWVDKNGKVWFYGGATRSDIWNYDLDSKIWTWVHGSDSAYAKPRYGNKGIADSSNNPGYRLGAAIIHDKDGNLWLYGGGQQNYLDFYDDLWKFNVLTGMWTWLKGQNVTSPIKPLSIKGVEDSIANPRCELYSTIWCDNENNIWIFGGFSQPRFSQELWRYNTQTNNWKWVHGGSNLNFINHLANYGQKGISSPNNVPGARNSGVGWTDMQGKLWLFGGYSAVDTSYIIKYINDLWRFDPITNEWTWMHGSNKHNQSSTYGNKGVGNTLTTPGIRLHANGIVDKNNNLLLFGGYTNYGRSNEFWKYDISNNKWVWFDGDTIYTEGFYSNPTNAKPGGRDNCASIIDKLGSFVLFNGYGQAENGLVGSLTDIWRKNLCDSILPSDTPKITVIKNVNCVGDYIKLIIDKTSQKNSADFWVWRIDSCDGKIIAYGDTLSTVTKIADKYFVSGKSSCFNGGICSSYEVVFVDSIKPEITAPNDLEYIADISCTKTIESLGSPICIENCNIKSVENDAPHVFKIGKTKVIWKITDESGNSDTSIQIISIKKGIDNEVLANGKTLYAIDSLKIHQWVDCDNNYAAIAGAQNATFIPKKTGSYAVIIGATNGCVDTSNCIPFNYIGLNEQEDILDVELWPNPTTTGIVNVRFNSIQRIPFAIFVTNPLGQQILVKQQVSSGNDLFTFKIDECTTGVYFLSIHSNKQIINRKFTFIN